MITFATGPPQAAGSSPYKLLPTHNLRICQAKESSVTTRSIQLSAKQPVCVCSGICNCSGYSKLQQPMASNNQTARSATAACHLDQVQSSASAHLFPSLGLKPPCKAHRKKARCLLGIRSGVRLGTTDASKLGAPCSSSRCACAARRCVSSTRSHASTTCSIFLPLECACRGANDRQQQLVSDCAVQGSLTPVC